ISSDDVLDGGGAPQGAPGHEGASPRAFPRPATESGSLPGLLSVSCRPALQPKAPEPSRLTRNQVPGRVATDRGGMKVPEGKGPRSKSVRGKHHEDRKDAGPGRGAGRARLLQLDL